MKGLRGRKIVIVTGSKLWRDLNVIWEYLDEVLEEIEADGFEMELHHGGSRGADAIANAWAFEKNKEAGYKRVLIERYEANWGSCSRTACGQRYQTHMKINSQGGSYCPTAGIRRNVRMVDDGAWRCVVFILNNSPGSRHCGQYAESKGIKTRWFPLGKPVSDSRRVDKTRPRS